MKNIEIKVSKTSRMVYLKNGNIGNDGENLQEKLIFSFQDKFVDGQARLEYEIGGEKYFAILTKVGESYELPIKNVITKEGQVNMQLVITEGADENEIPVFKSNVFYVFVNKSINAETEEPDGYAQWLDIANTKLNSIDEAILGVQEAIDYAQEQGDYAKKQAENVTNANEEAIEIIRHFESDVEEYTTAFNENATNKTTDYNTNATNKVTEYNDNATEKLNAYNTNANSKVEEYNENADNRINDFNQNADSYLDAIVPKNDASGVPIYVDDALGYRVLNLDAKGNYEQETTTGKNLFNPNNVKRENNSTLEITSTGFNVTRTHGSGYGDEFVASYTIENLQPNTIYTFNLDFESENTFTNNNIYVYSDSLFGTTLTKTNYEENGNNRKWNITTDGNGKIVIGFYGKTITQNIPFNFTNIQLELGTTATDFEKFTNGASPNPDFPSEIEVLEGYNLFDKNAFEEQIVSGKIINDSGVEINDTTSSYSTYSVYLKANTPYHIKGAFQRIYHYDEDGNFVSRSVANDGIDRAYTPSKNEYIKFQINNDYWNGNKGQEQLVEGVEKTYLPYSNVAYKSIGKNLFNTRKVVLSNTTSYTNIDDNNAIIVSNTNESFRYVRYEINDIKPNTNYRFKANFTNSNTNAKNSWLLITGKETNVNIHNASYSKEIVSINSGENTSLLIRLYATGSLAEANTTTWNDIELAEASQFGDYKPYREPIVVPIDLKGNFVGELPNGVADNLLYKDRHIYLEKNVGKVVLDGSEVWQDRPDYTYADRFVVYALFPNNYKDILSNYFIFSRTIQDTYPIATNNDQQLVINFSAKGTTTLAQFKEWLVENKPEVYYQLATPQLIDLGEYDLSTLQGTNNISLLANIEPSDMNLTYALDIKKYIDKKVQ